MQFRTAWKGPPQQFDDVRNVFSPSVLIACGPPKPNQETGVASDAVADCTKARKKDEKPFLKNRGERVVEIGCLGKPPQFFGDLGSLRRELEKVRKHAK